MQKPMTQILIKAGIVPPETIALMHRWGMLVEPLDEGGAYDTPEAITEAIQEVVDRGETVKLRDTDLDIIKQYINNQQAGRLYLKDEETGQRANAATFYCRTRLGEYVIPWRSESIVDLLIEPHSYLKTEDGEKVHFSDVRELFFGDEKAFMVCEASE